jgi:hypothetical protein
MHDKQQDTYSRSQENTGEWLLKNKAFVDWIERNDSHSILWFPGNRTYFVLIFIIWISDFKKRALAKQS